METQFKYRGRIVTDADVSFIRDLIARHPNASRRQISKLLCEAWNWKQSNGAPCDILCRGLLLALFRAGRITLPDRRKLPPNNMARHFKPAPVAIDTSPLQGELEELLPLEFIQVRRTKSEALFDALIEQFHYLRYVRPVGEHLKFLVFSRGRPVACLAFSSAPRHLGPRDRFIGWSREMRRNNIRLVAYNPRFLIPPWVRVRCLASHVLSRVARMLPAQWEGSYAHPVHFLETFVDPQLYRGTCYKAANWICLGRTTGRGKDDHTNKPNRSIKEVWGYPLAKNFRELLCGDK